MTGFEKILGSKSDVFYFEVTQNLWKAHLKMELMEASFKNETVNKYTVKKNNIQ